MGAEKIIGKLMSEAKSNMDKTSQDLNEKFDAIQENQNEQMRALATIYELLKKLAENSKIEIPEPLIDMSIEEEKNE